VEEVDLWLYDVTEAKLQGIARSLLDVDHLSPADSEKQPYYPPRGELCDERLVVSLVCRHDCHDRRYDSKTATPLNVVFVVNTGVWGSYLSEKTMNALKGGVKCGSDAFMAVRIENIAFHVWRSHGHFVEANVLGMGALRKLGWSPLIDWKGESFVLDNAGLYGKGESGKASSSSE